MSTEDRERFETLYDATKTKIVAYVLRRVAVREDAADLVSEVYEVAWRRIDSVPRGEAGLLWLYVTARQLLANRQRSLRRREEIRRQLLQELDAIELVEQPSDAESLYALFVFNSLPEEHREVLMLASWEGLSAGEIGRVMNCSATAARIRLHRARALLRLEIETRPETHPVHRVRRELDEVASATREV